MKIKNKKANQSLAVMILVLGTITLVVLSLVNFGYRQNNLGDEIKSISGFDKIYAEAEILNFYLREISSGINSQDKVVDNFLIGLNKYKDKNGYFIDGNLNQIKNQLDENPGEHVKVVEGKLIVDFDMELLEVIYYGDGKRNFEEKYDYNFHYEKELVA